MRKLFEPIFSIKPLSLQEISEAQLEDHWNLYLGYVSQSNTLQSELDLLAKNGHGNSSEYQSKLCRLSFELNGKVLHELYFSSLTSDQSLTKFSPSFDKLANALIQNFGSYDAWEQNFKNVGKVRGPGWAILGQNIWTGELINYFVSEHQIGNIAGYLPILVMDVWEHAYMVDHGSSGRSLYIESFFKNINWKAASNRLK